MRINVWILCTALLALSSSATADNNGLIGALTGAGGGAGVGHAVDRSGGAGKGALIGAIGGYVIGSQMERDKQQAAAQPPVARSADCSRAERYMQRAARSRDNDDWIYALEQAVKLCPQLARAYNDLGVAYYQRNQRHDRDRARAEFNEALRIDPGYTVARRNLRRL